MPSDSTYLFNAAAAADRLVRLAVYADDGKPKTGGVAGAQPDVILHDGSVASSPADYAGALSQIGATEHYLCQLTAAAAQQAELVLRLPDAAGANNPSRSRTFRAMAYDPRDAAGLGLSRLDAAVTSRLAPAVAGRALGVDAAGKVAATLAAGDVAGDLPANATRFGGQPVAAAGPVTVPASIGTSTFAAGGSVVASNFAAAPTPQEVRDFFNANPTPASNMRGTDGAMLAASYLAPDNAGVAAIRAKTDNLPGQPAAAGDAMSLLPSEREATATVVESHLLDEGDSQPLIDAIVSQIGAADIDEASFVAAVRADVERAGGLLASRASQASLDALGEPLQAGDYAAAPSPGDVAAALRGNLAAELGRLDAAVSSRSTYAGGDTPGTAALLARASEARLAKLDVAGDLAHSGDAATYRADVSGLLGAAAFAGALPGNFGSLLVGGDGKVTTSIPPPDRAARTPPPTWRRWSSPRPRTG